MGACNALYGGSNPPIASKRSAMSNLIQRNIQHVRERITQACQRVGRDPQSIKLLLVTKTVEPERIREAVQYGLTELGENRVQEARRKVKQKKDDSTPMEWHLHGHT